MSVGKGIGGGLGLAAVLGRHDVMTTWQADAVTATFLTNALNLAAAGAAVDVLVEERLVERSARLGEVALARLAEALDGHEQTGSQAGPHSNAFTCAPFHRARW